MIEEILDHFGGVAKLARKLGVRSPAVSQWRTNGIPADRAIEIERLTDGKFKAVDIVNVKMEDSNDKQ